MKKIYLLVAIALVSLSLLFVLLTRNKPAPPTFQTPQAEQPVFDAKNASFTIESQKITLENGSAKMLTALGSSIEITTTYAGNESIGDINGDSLEDIAFLVTQKTGESGLFYYAVVALKTSGGFITTNAFYVGENITPQLTKIDSDSKVLSIQFAPYDQTEPTPDMTLFLKVGADGVLHTF